MVQQTQIVNQGALENPDKQGAMVVSVISCRITPESSVMTQNKQTNK